MNENNEGDNNHEKVEHKIYSEGDESILDND
jgi:hypothetical protein